MLSIFTFLYKGRPKIFSKIEILTQNQIFFLKIEFLRGRSPKNIHPRHLYTRIELLKIGWQPARTRSILLFDDASEENEFVSDEILVPSGCMCVIGAKKKNTVPHPIILE